MGINKVLNELRNVRLTLHNDSQYALELSTQLKNKDFSGFVNEEALINELVTLLGSINETIKT